MGILPKGLIGCLVLAPLVSVAQVPMRDLRTVSIQPEAWQIVMLGNKARAEVGAGPLEWDPALAAAARQHCLQMAAEGPISHRYPGELDVAGRAGVAGAHFSLIEENVAVGPTPASIHNGWMHSPDHRANLLSPDVDRVGVAIVASRGVLYAVADYERVVPVLTASQVESTVGELLSRNGLNISNASADARTSCAQGRLATAGDQPRFFMFWQGADLSRLPSALVDRIASGRYREAEVGSCPAQSADGTFTAYRVAVLLH